MGLVEFKKDILGDLERVVLRTRVKKLGHYDGVFDGYRYKYLACF